MVPPAVFKVLSMFSFRGDRETGLSLLWKAGYHTTNINGGLGMCAACCPSLFMDLVTLTQSRSRTHSYHVS